MSIFRSIACVRSLALPLAFFACVPASSAESQRADSLRIGARVRVDTRITTPRRLIGILEAADSSALAVLPDGRPPVLVPYSDIETISVGRREARPGGARRGAKRGALLGLGTTVVAAGLASAIAAAVGYRPGSYEPSVPVTVAILGVPFTALTTIVGAIVGTTDRTVWRQVWPRTPAR